jgi:dTMP kinase
MPERDVRAANTFATGGLVPDLTILLTFPVRDGLARAGNRASAHDRIEALGEAFHDRVATAFAEFGTPAWQQSHPECGAIVPIDAEGSEDVVGERIHAALRERWPDFFQQRHA